MTTPLLWLASSLAHSLPRHAARRLPASLPTVHQRTRRRPLCTCAPEELHVAGLSYDLETTGIGPDAEIVQIAVHVANSARAEPPSFQSLVMPSGPIQPGATAVHGFTRESLEAADAQQFGTVWGKLEEWLQATLGSERPLVWCAHNGDRFDHPILTRCARAACPGIRRPCCLTTLLPQCLTAHGSDALLPTVVLPYCLLPYRLTALLPY